METHGIEEPFFQGCGCNLLCKRGCAKNCRKGRAAGCVAFLVKAMKLARKAVSSFGEILSVKRMVVHQVSGVLACGTDQKWSFFCPRRKKGSIVENGDVERPSSSLFFINITNNIENIGAQKEKLCDSDITLLCLRTFAN